MEILGHRKNILPIDFASKEYFVMNSQEYLQDTKEKFPEHVDSGIITEMGGTMENNDNTSLNYNFIGNDRKPFYTCTWLASKP